MPATAAARPAPAAPAERAPTEVELDALAASAHPRWEVRERPFRHWVARDVFPAEVYAKLEASFRAVLARGLSEPSDNKRLSYRMKGYDAYSLTLTRLGSPLQLFQTRRWHDLLAGLTGIDATRDVSGALHHHKVGSANGKIHNDFNPAYFIDRHKADGINVNDPKVCNYQDGKVFVPGATARACVRGVACLYYLANPPWQPGDGGETGLFKRAKVPLDQHEAAVPPHSNSIVVFECAPGSYHSFLRNVKSERNCVVMWLHRTRAEAVERWGESKIIGWSK